MCPHEFLDHCLTCHSRHRSHVLGRASVGLHTEMYFANNPTEEDAFVLSVQKNSLSVIVPRFGIEGTVRGVLTL